MTSEFKNEKEVDHTVTMSSTDEDDAELVALGYVPSFKREFSNLATVSTKSLSLDHFSDHADFCR
jgi:hypothetical protein